MKKIILFILLLITICLIPNVYAADDVKIESIDVLEKSENTEVLTPASFNGLDIDLDIRFLEKDDYILYKVVVANDSNKDYKINNTTNFGASDHIKYEYSYNDGNSVVKANSKQTMSIRVSYARLVDPSQMDASGTYTEQKNMVVKLSRGSSIIANPETGNAIIALLIITVIVCTASIIGIRKHNKVTAMLLIIGLSLPITILALDELQIKVNSKVTINTLSEFCVYDYPLIVGERVRQTPDENYTYYLESSYKYKTILGLTFTEFKNTKYFNQVGSEVPANREIFDELDEGISNLKLHFDNENIDLLLVKTDGTTSRVSETDKIVPCTVGVYKLDESQLPN